MIEGVEAVESLIIEVGERSAGGCLLQ